MWFQPGTVKEELAGLLETAINFRMHTAEMGIYHFSYLLAVAKQDSKNPKGN